MLIDLFSDKAVTSDMFRLLSQVETREFNLNCEKETVLNLCEDDEAFKNRIADLLGKKREYKQEFSCSYDSHFLLEALGIGTDCRKYTIIVDMSDKLDFILHRLTGCPIEKIRLMDNYANISKGILTLNESLLSGLQLKHFLDLDPSISKWLLDLMNDLTMDSSFNDNELIDLLLIRFIRQILHEMNNVRNYIMMFLRHTYKSVVIRSKSISCILATTDIDIETDYSVAMTSVDDTTCNLKIWKFEKFEFFTGGAYNVFSWTY